MGAATVDGPDGPNIQSVEEMIGRFTSELVSLMPQWKTRLMDDPSQLESLERDVHIAFARGADLLVAGLVLGRHDAKGLSQCGSADEERIFSLTCKRTRAKDPNQAFWRTDPVGQFPVLRPEKEVATRTGRDAKGLYIELAQFGCGKGVSPGLQSRVARQAALCPSLQVAHQQLTRDGVQIDPKAVPRVAYQCGESLLRLRKHELTQWRNGVLPKGDELKGKRVSVQFDGGRTKNPRENRARRSISRENR